MAGNVTTVRVLVASETGNASMVGADLAAAARALGAEVDASPLKKLTPADLADCGALLAVISTTGDGEVPYEGLEFWEALSVATPDLTDIPFAVFGLGDTGYFDYCKSAEDFDSRFADLGGRRLLDLVKCDVEFEDEAEAWIPQVLGLVAPLLGLADPEPTVAVAESHREAPAWGRSHPFAAEVLSNVVITAPEALKAVRHIEVSVAGWGTTYRPGDALGIVPSNDPALVDVLLARLGESGETEVNGRRLREAFTHDLEISRPSKALVERLGATGEHELAVVLRGGDRVALREFLFARDVIDLLDLADEVPPVAELLGLLHPLAHRSYSIASSALVDPDRIALTVAELRYAERGRDRGGVCTTYLADRLADGAHARVFLVPNEHFQPPADDAVPMIMIGPGTGVAPFRGFLHERRARGATGRNWLFFGSRHRHADFLYGEEFTAMTQAGLLTRLDVAFSRDQADKIYVQHRMREHGKELHSWLEEGAALFVCGDEAAMADDVDRVLHEIVAEHGGISEQAAADYVDALRTSGRYAREVY